MTDRQTETQTAPDPIRAALDCICKGCSLRDGGPATRACSTHCANPAAALARLAKLEAALGMADGILDHLLNGQTLPPEADTDHALTAIRAARGVTK